MGRGKKVTAVYGTTVNASGSPVGGVWMKVQQGTGPSVLIRSDEDSGEYLIFDTQACGDGTFGCVAGTSWNFVNGTQNATFTVLGNLGTITAPLVSTATYPTIPPGSAPADPKYTKFSVYQGNQTFVNNSTAPPVYTFGVAKGTATKRNSQVRSLGRHKWAGAQAPAHRLPDSLRRKLFLKSEPQGYPAVGALGYHRSTKW